MTPEHASAATDHATALSSTRLFAAVALALVTACVAWAAREIYHAATDSFVAPIILTPDNDAVIASKVSLGQLEVEHARVVAELAGIDADLASSEQASARLRSLAGTIDGVLDWVRGQNARQEAKGAGELALLGDQAATLRRMIAEQERVTANAAANLRAGLLSESEYARERLALNQLRLALLENGRTRIDSAAQAREVRLASASLRRGGQGPTLPEQILREDQRVRIELELLKLDSERRTRGTERRLLREKLARLEEVETQLKARPLYRAAEANLEVAFVPYTQLEGVRPGASVYRCVWGLVHCRRAGTIAEVVKGEVILPDPWGNQARGQYAVLDLVDHSAAEEKTLRVRAGR